jgi:alginate O-acetyltransferase complex protein AlgI
MAFSGNVFIFMFLPIFFILYAALPKIARKGWLLLASLFFYAWGNPSVLYVLSVSIIINYTGGLFLKRFNERNAHFLFAICIIFNVSLLFCLKYLNFTISNFNFITGQNLVLMNIIQPIGISFYTFKGISYLADIYNDKIRAEKNLLNFALYMSIFPEVMEGPIDRYGDISKQFSNASITVDGFVKGIERFSIGLTKKVLLSDTMGVLADSVYSIGYSQNGSATAWVGAIAYMLQIYFDFSGYTDMAIGIGNMMGYHFTENFDYPYTAVGITDFWRKWHMSLTKWFRDYIYIPMGGNRKGFGRQVINMFVVWLLTGFWHGASWNFVFWGLWNFIFLLIEKILLKKKKPHGFFKIMMWAGTMLVVLLGWVFFRADNLPNAFGTIGVMFGFIHPSNVGFSVFWYLNRKNLFIMILAILTCIPWKQIVPQFKYLFESITGHVLKAVLCLGLMCLNVLLVMNSTYQSFIYFKF